MSVAPMYRDTQLAAHAQIDALRGDLRSLEAELARAREEGEAARRALEDAREGVDWDPAIDRLTGYRWAQRWLRLLAGASMFATIVVITVLLIETFEAPLFTLEGLRNLGFHLTRGGGALGLAQALGLALLLSPLFLLPGVAAVGLRRHRKWGWLLGVASCVLYLPTPFALLAVHGLAVLLSWQVRRVYFPKPSALGDLGALATRVARDRGSASARDVPAPREPREEPVARTAVEDGLGRSGAGA